ncbi:MAG: methylenetetrahydrofolate reductase [Thermodesulfobacteriota bacterium]
MHIQQAFKSGKFLVLAEMNTPKGVDISRFMTDVRHIQGRVDGVVVPDMDNGVMRMSALAGAALLRQAGIDAFITTYGRDRNRLAIQGDLLAAQVLGVTGVVVVTGEPMANSDHRDAKPVNDLDEIGILRCAAQLKTGKDLAGFDLDGSPEWMVGCTLPATADDAALDREIESARIKIESGASFLITPPVFDVDRFKTTAPKLKALGVPIIATVFLIKSVAVARYIATNEPGAHLSEETIARIRKASDRELECIRIAGETAAHLKSVVSGVLIQTMGWEHRLPAVLDAAGMS